MIICIAQFRAEPEKLNKLQTALKKLVPLSLAEDGCNEYLLSAELKYSEEPEETWDVTLHEKWVSRAAFNSHCAQPYIVNFFENVAPACVIKSDIRLYQPLVD